MSNPYRRGRKLIGVEMEPGLVRRLDKQVEKLRATGLTPSRADVIRSLLIRALDAESAAVVPLK